VTRASSTSSGGPDDELERSKFVMQRSVSQLLFNYLPGRTVDWEDGIAIVQLGSARLSSAWDDDKCSAVLNEVGAILNRWRSKGGQIDSKFPDPHLERSRFVIGPPNAIEAQVLECALVCARCSRLFFFRVNSASKIQESVTCPSCGSKQVRQMPYVFVHGCGELVPFREWVPAMKKTADDCFEPSTHPIKCQTCGDKSELFIAARTERVKDLRIICKRCSTQLNRIVARCPYCVRLSARTKRKTGDNGPNETIVSRVAMRVTRYSASDTYYPQPLTVLRLRESVVHDLDTDELALKSLLPRAHGMDVTSGPARLIALAKALEEAVNKSDLDAVKAIKKMIVKAASGQETNESVVAPSGSLSPDVEKSVREAVAFRETVRSQNAIQMLSSRTEGRGLFEDAVNACSLLGFKDVSLIEDLPIITATFGYTRRTFEPTYEEYGAKTLPTYIRPFYSLDAFAARKISRPDFEGAIPILAREGEHEGIYLSLDPKRVAKWLSLNGVQLPNNSETALIQIFKSLEENSHRYYDDIWELPTRRLVFGLLHSISHVAMRAVSRFAGVERTSLSEYIFLPLLGTVVYDASGAFKLGGIEAMVRDHLPSFLNCLAEEAMTCLYDPQCIDHAGACHGCIHAPEISCRVFNHGLSRAFLLGGHSPWLDASDNSQVVGYWDMQ
jgi:hypothetical protein